MHPLSLQLGNAKEWSKKHPDPPQTQARPILTGPSDSSSSTQLTLVRSIGHHWSSVDKLISSL